MTGLRTAPPKRVVLAFGAFLTVVAAAAFDLFAGEAPVHAATLGVIAALAAALRVRLAGPRCSLAQFVCGCIVSQPVLHYAAKLLPHAGLEHGVGNVPGPADVFVSSIQTMVVLAVVVAFTCVEQILLVLAIRAVRLCIVRLRSICQQSELTRFANTAAPGIALLVGRYHPGSIVRRGPPPSPVYLQ